MIGAMLEAFERLGTATVGELMDVMEIDVTRVSFLLLDALDQGLVSIALDRPDAYERARS